MGYTASQQKRIANGLCARCGKKRDVNQSKSCCAACLQKRRDAGRERYADKREQNPPYGPDTGRVPYRLGGAVKLGAVGAVNFKLCVGSHRALVTLLRTHWAENGKIEPYRRSAVIRAAINKMATYKGPPVEAGRSMETDLPSIQFTVDVQTQTALNRYRARFGCGESAAVRTLLIAAARPQREWVLVTASDSWD